MARGSAPEKNGGGSTTTRTASTKETKLKRLSVKQQLEQIVGDVATITRRQVPELIGAIERTKGTERGTVTVTIAYNPGSANTKARIEVKGRLASPDGGFSRLVGLTEKRDGGLQLDMFEDQPS